jgi:PKD repeat protein
MHRQAFGRSAAALLGLTFALFASPATAFAASPANDDFGSATVVAALPFSDQVDNTTATLEAGEPQCSPSPRTVWYSFTPAADEVVKVDMDGSSFFDTGLAVYRSSGGGFGGLSFVPNGCEIFGDSVFFDALAGTTYYFQAADYFNGGGDLHLNVQAIPPPANDAFANTTAIGSLPFNDSLDMTAATLEPGEPQPSTPIGRSTWYAFTPPVTQTLSATGTTGSPYFAPIVTVYTGSSLGGLTKVKSGVGQPATFRADAGVTYHFQLAIPQLSLPVTAPMTFGLEVTPPPVAGFFYSPGDPTIFDTVQFVDQSFDPGQAGFQLESWELGDGTHATGCCPTHRYAADGDYTVRLTVTTTDGRTASTSQVVHVRTHDVAITKFTTPQTASAGQTRQITVGVSDNRYSEIVQVQLFKSTPGGTDLVGTLTQSVPVRGANRTTGFDFSYTFTSDDATVGKVTFRAAATILGPRDALPADNEAIASPTKVSH